MKLQDFMLNRLGWWLLHILFIVLAFYLGHIVSFTNPH